MLSRATTLRRNGSSLLEIILGLPILLILLLAVVQFGLLQSNQQALHLASRQAGLVAAELPLPPNGEVPIDIIEAINLVLRENGVLAPAEDIRTVGGVRVEHSFSFDESAGGSPPFVLQSGDNPVAPPMNPDLPREYVQVTVSIEATRLAPNTLAFFGINYAGRYASQTSLYRHEL